MSAKVLVVGQLPPPVHGSNVMTERFLAALEEIGYKALLVQKTFSRKAEEVGIFSCHKLFKAPAIILQVLCKLSVDSPTICVFFLSLGPMSFIFDALLLMLLRLFRVPYVLYIHGVGARRLGDESGFLCRCLFHATVPRSIGALVLGECLKDDVCPYISHDQIFILPNAISEIQDSPLCATTPTGSVKVLFLSNLRPKKGVMEFLRMATIVAANCKNVEFLMVGPCRSRDVNERIADFINTAGLSDRIRLLGALYGEEKDLIFKACHIFVFPSHDEASPLVVLEAMQKGLPVVASNVGCIPEMVIDGKTGYVIDYKDIDGMAERVISLVASAAHREAMGFAGRERVCREYGMARYRAELAKIMYHFSEQ